MTSMLCQSKGDVAASLQPPKSATAVCMPFLTQIREKILAVLQWCYLLYVQKFTDEVKVTNLCLWFSVLQLMFVHTVQKWCRLVWCLYPQYFIHYLSCQFLPTISPIDQQLLVGWQEDIQPIKIHATYPHKFSSGTNGRKTECIQVTPVHPRNGR